MKSMVEYQKFLEKISKYPDEIRLKLIQFVDDIVSEKYSKEILSELILIKMKHQALCYHSRSCKVINGCTFVVCSKCGKKL